MRTNIDIDDDLMARALQAGPYKTKREAVEAGLKLLARQATYQEILKWEGKLRWEGDEADEAIDWTKPADAVEQPATPAAGALGPGHGFGAMTPVGPAAAVLLFQEPGPSAAPAQASASGPLAIASSVGRRAGR